MADVGIEQLKADIQDNIKTNNSQAITGAVLQGQLIDTVDTLKGYTDDHVSVSQNTTTDSDGNGTISIGGTEVGQYAGADKLVELIGFGTNGENAGVTEVGDVYYNTSTKLLRRCITFNTVYETIPYFDGAIYTYNNELYVWNGSDLVISGLNSIINVNDINNLPTTAYGSNALARAAVTAASGLRVQGQIITYLLADGWYTEQYVGADVADWATDANWKSYQIDDEPEAGSDNLVKSGGIYNQLTAPLLGAIIAVTPISSVRAGIGNDGSYSVKKVCSTTNDYYRVSFYPIQAGKKYHIFISNTRYSYPAVYCNTLLTENPPSDVTMSEAIQAYSGFTNNGGELEFDIDSANNFLYVMICHTKDTPVTFNEIVAGEIPSIKANIEDIEGSIEDIEESIDGTKTDITASSIISALISATNNTLGSSIILSSTNNVNQKVAFFPIEEGKNYEILIPRTYGQANGCIGGYANELVTQDIDINTNIGGIITFYDYYNTYPTNYKISVKGCPDYMYLVLLFNASEGNPTVKEITQEGLSDITVTQLEDLTDKLIPIQKLYGLAPVSSSINIAHKIYGEGLIKEYIDLKLNGQPNVTIIYNTSGTKRDLVNVSSDGYGVIPLSAESKITAKSAAKNKDMRIMCIGDSLTDGGYPALTEFIFKSINNEIGNVKALMVGNLIENKQITLNGESYQCRGCNVGMSGHSITSYMRHVVLVRPSATTATTGYMSGEVAWYSLGLATKTRNGSSDRSFTAYTGTAAQKLEIITTCHGYYDADTSESLWNYLKNTRGITSFVYDNVTYTFGDSYSSADDAAQKAAIKYICTSDDWASRREPFYDYQTVQDTNGEYAFDIEAYLAKYKTLQDDGQTRLIVGETAGSLVSDVDAWDVCTPNYFVIIMSVNDFGGAGVDNASVIADTAALMASAILSKIPTAKIAIGCTRRFGAINPNDYREYGDVGHLTNNPNFFNYDKNVFLRLIELSGSSQWDLLNVYQSQTVIGEIYKYIDTTYNQEKLYRSEDDLHTGFYRYLDRAYQVAAWVVSN